MGFKTIVIHVDSFKPSTDHINHAIELARQNEAHLIGLAPSGFASLPAGDYLGTSARYISEMQQDLDESAKKAAEIFDKACAHQGLASYESRAITDSVIQSLLLHASYADLIVVSQPDPDPASTIAGPGLVGDLLMEASRPVLVLPAKVAAPPYETVVVGWDASREAARAIADGLPLLKAATQVEIVVINPEDRSDAHGEVPGADLATYLARHDIKGNVNQIHSQNSVGEALLNQISALNADLLVMGGYGHSRLREWVLGGTTRNVLSGMSVPALMSH